MATDNKQQNKEDIEEVLYKKREKIYPREVHGIFARLRNIAMLALLGIFYIMPCIHGNAVTNIIIFTHPRASPIDQEQVKAFDEASMARRSLCPGVHVVANYRQKSEA